jgi:hypothetical protein
MTIHSLRLRAALCLAALGAAAPASAELIYGVASLGVAQNLYSWDSATPLNIVNAPFITGLQNNESILGIDFRPANGQLYALGSSSRLYTLNTATGAATQVGAPFSTSLNGSAFGFDFNPQIDRIRVVSETNQNLVIDPNTGAVATVATPLFYAAGDPNAGTDPNVVDSAYDNNVAGGTPTQLYGIDTFLNILVRQANSAGTLDTVGPLGAAIDPGAAGAFDVSGSGVAYAALLPQGGSASSFYTINLATGAATLVGLVDGGVVITAMSATPIPEPGTIALAACGLVGCMLLRRRR